MNLPFGTVSFVMTDVVGSTQAWERDPTSMRDAVARHDALAEAVIAANEGHIVKGRGEGDSLFCVFERATNAARAAMAFQKAINAEPWPETILIRTRIAIHTGDVELRDADYYGPTVNRTARIRGLAHGGQILLSSSTHQLVCDELGSDVRIDDLGEHRLRDLSRPERLYQLMAKDDSGEFPPLPSLDTVPNNLPMQLTSFVGRERELAELRALMEKSRLLTITGMGGAGKTRLSLQLAADLLDAERDGVWFVELASILDASLVAQTVASAISVREESLSAKEAIIAFLRPLQAMLILDNCEQVLASVADLTDGILRACPGVRVLATSREALGIAGESHYRLPSLPTPDPKTAQKLDELQEFESVRLFVDRARSADPSFQLDDSNASAVAQICSRLDGIPLALELAAARIRAMPIGTLASRLDDRFRLLTGGSRTALARQQTLRALIDWSYDLLDDRERRLLLRLSVFAAGWTLDGAEQVCCDDETDGISRYDLYDVLASLVDKSLAIYEDGRYRMLETIRQYGAGRLAESPQAPTVRDRHAAFFCSLAQNSREGMRGAEQPRWLAQLDLEIDNFNAAMEWGLSGSPAACEVAAMTAGALTSYWAARGRYQEALYWLRRAASTDCMRPEMTSFARHRLATMLAQKGDFLAALEVQEDLVADARARGDDPHLGDALSSMAYALFCAGRVEESVSVASEALEIARRMKSVSAEGNALTTLALAAVQAGDTEAAWEHGQQVLAARRKLGGPRQIAVALANLGQIARARGDLAQACGLFLEAVGSAAQTSARQSLGHALEGLGACAVAADAFEDAARLLGKGEAILRELDVRPDPIDRLGYEDTVAQLRAQLADEAFWSAWAAGSAMSDQDAIDLAMQVARVRAVERG